MLSSSVGYLRLSTIAVFSSVCHLLAFLNGMVSVTENFRFYNGDESVGLTDGSVPRYERQVSSPQNYVTFVTSNECFRLKFLIHTLRKRLMTYVQYLGRKKNNLYRILSRKRQTLPSCWRSPWWPAGRVCCRWWSRRSSTWQSGSRPSCTGSSELPSRPCPGWLSHPWFRAIPWCPCPIWCLKIE